MRSAAGLTRRILAGASVGVLALCVWLLTPASEAFAQRVCRLDDTACQQQRMQNTRNDTLWRHGYGRERERPNLQQRYYGDRTSPGPGGQANGNCDVKPVISGQNTRVVPTC